MKTNRPATGIDRFWHDPEPCLSANSHTALFHLPFSATFMEIRKLNSLRGIAALIVLVSHYSNESGLLGKALGSGGGQFGVMLFFLLSAFLISYLYLHQQPRRPQLTAYFRARAGRVLPLFLFTVLACWGARQVLPPPFRDMAFDVSSGPLLASHLLLFFGSNVLWTIPPEIHFYVFFGLIWPVWRMAPRAVGMAMLAGAAMALALGKGQEFSTTLFGLPLTINDVKAFPYFVTGLLLGQLYRHWRPPAARQHALYVLSLAVLPLLYPMIFESITGLKHAMWGDPLILLAVGGVFFLTVFMVPAGNYLLENPIGDFLGKVSYSAYLLHYPLLLVLKEFGLARGISGLALFLLLTALLSETSFRLLEAPMRRLIRGPGRA